MINDQQIKKLLNHFLSAIDTMLTHHRSLEIINCASTDLATLVTEYRNIIDDIFHKPTSYINKYELLKQHANMRKYLKLDNPITLTNGQIRLRLLDNTHVLICINPKINDDLLNQLVDAYQLDQQHRTKKPKTNKEQIKQHFYIQFTIATVIVFMLAIYFFFNVTMKLHSILTWSIVLGGLIIATISIIRATMLQKQYHKIIVNEKTHHFESKPTINSAIYKTITKLNNTFKNYMVAKTDIK